MEQIVQFLGSNTFVVALVNLTSIIGFALTIWVLIDVKNIKSYYVFRVRVPQHIEQLQDFASHILDLKNRFEESLDEIDVVLANTDVELESLIKKVNKETQVSLKNLRKQIQEYSATFPRSERQLWEIYIALNKVIGKVSNLQQDQNWEK